MPHLPLQGGSPTDEAPRPRDTVPGDHKLMPQRAPHCLYNITYIYNIYISYIIHIDTKHI